MLVFGPAGAADPAVEATGDADVGGCARTVGPLDAAELATGGASAEASALTETDAVAERSALAAAVDSGVAVELAVASALTVAGVLAVVSAETLVCATIGGVIGGCGSRREST